ncbi:hypothetical protein lacNasYZ03_03910 [Lactobacillus nasalidis]|uniref:Zinc-ribbon domain-containing protein n=1 Tax=Lactobacillus nasalidis TaxID=2797258 RepID=A0ABQ3W5W5_9LACO|nr:DUF898 family protein [Lactobacillus nasalidis]GHV97060.1 hypothetical protein lacNasYZ01_02420 [Lactobacillus nasalidis]GHV99081.1 hypothetical protein lacNasYZ02_05110 [Lactobacillus nasalidis]GHW00704.1 hypothetical protein lacNasYZ03_03910 [Lactobacillus nasalidis]
MYCIHCGTKLPEGANFCVKCGAPVEKVESAAKNEAKAPVKKSSETKEKQASISQVDDKIDQMGEQIGQGMDDAAKDISSSLKKTGEKTGDFWQNWRDYLTPDYLEKYASLALLFPLFMTVVLWAVNLLSNWFYSQYLLPFNDLFHVVSILVFYLVRAVFLIGSALGIAAAGYVLYKNESKRTVWGWITGAASVFAFLGCLGINQSYNYFMANPGLTHTYKILGWIAVVWGIDTCSKVLLQNIGIAVEPIISRDLAAYQQFYRTYRAKHEAEEKAEIAEIEKAKSGQAGPVSYFDGTGSGLFGTYLLYLLLTIITCGFAAPWLNCAIQRWRTQHMVVDGKRVTFNGTGASLLGHWILWEFLTIITCGIFVFFIPVGLQKWNMNHTYYEGEKGADDSLFDGNTFQYIGYNIVQFLLLVLTIGLAYPWTHNMILSWQTKHQLINNDRLTYDGTALGMFWRALVLAIVLAIPFGFLASPWAFCWLWRYQYAHTHVDHSPKE